MTTSMEIEPFEKIWNDKLNEYETIPDKTKISNEDKELARGYYAGIIDFIDEVEQSVEDIATDDTIIDKMRAEILLEEALIIKDNLEAKLDDLITGILDSYVE